MSVIFIAITYSNVLHSYIETYLYVQHEFHTLKLKGVAIGLARSHKLLNIVNDYGLGGVITIIIHTKVWTSC